MQLSTRFDTSQGRKPWKGVVRGVGVAGGVAQHLKLKRCEWAGHGERTCVRARVLMSECACGCDRVRMHHLSGRGRGGARQI